jgi:malate dehydrogenase (oxaloacetate-decarboxylating)(NADP+)
MIRRHEALAYHLGDRAGKIEVKPTKPCLSPREMRLAYLPGAAGPAEEIAADPANAYRYTARGNLVAMVTNGSLVPGLGDVGPLASKPFQEGASILFKQLADIDVFDLELDVRDTDRFVDAVRMLEPTVGGINLRDIRAPQGLEIYDRLREELSIPIFHENLYGTAVVCAAALINVLDLTEKHAGDIQVVICGAGNAGLGCARLMISLGVRRENLLLYDIHGLICPEREDLNDYQRAYAREHPARALRDGIRGADVFVGVSAGGVLTPEMVRDMNDYPAILATAVPEPEISYEAARAVRRDVIVATSAGRDPNTLVDLLSFPYIFRGALDVQASRITEPMMVAAARALAELAREDIVEEIRRAYGDEPLVFGPEYLLPKPIDPRILLRESAAVAAEAVAEGVARRPIETGLYEESLIVRLGTGRELLRQVMLKARQVAPRLVLPEGTNETILRSCHILVDEGIASPVLLGRETEVRAAAEKLGVDLGGVTVIDPVRSPQFDPYLDTYFRLRARRGVTLDSARTRIAEPRYFASMMLRAGDADMMIAGLTAHYADSMRVVLEIIGAREGVRRVSSLFALLRQKEVYFLADCAVNIEPNADGLAESALLSAQMVRSLGIEPRVAMLAFSNFGSVDHAVTRRVREATCIARECDPDLVIDGEMQLITALNEEMRRRCFPFCELRQDANVLIFPDLQSGNLALHLLQKLGDAVAVGPLLMGTRRPVHLLQHGSSVEDVVNLTAMGAVAAADARG